MTYANEEVISVDEVKAKLESFGLTCNDPDYLKHRANVQGLKVWGERDTLCWKRGTAIPEPLAEMTQCTVFSMCGKLVGHFPFCGWLSVIARVLKRCVTAVTKGWDDPVDDASLSQFVEEVQARVTRDDPVQGNWSVSTEELNAWVVANSLATSVVLERHSDILEDACWLHPTNDIQHINLAELDATVKGLNFALQWQARTVHLHIDSMCVYHWLTDALTGRTKVASKMLVQRRLTVLQQLICEYGLQVNVTFVVSEQNLVDELTQVPKK